MRTTDKTKYATIGHHLSMHLLSPQSYGLHAGRAYLDNAYNDFFLMGNASPPGFRFQRIEPDDVDFFAGPDLVIGSSDDDEGTFDNALIAFVYDNLDFWEGNFYDNNFYKAYQARLLFDEIIDRNDNGKSTCSALADALNLLSMKENAHYLLHKKHFPILLGVHRDVISDFPKIGATMLDAGFKRDGRSLATDQLHLYHKNTAWSESHP